MRVNGSLYFMRMRKRKQMSFFGVDDEVTLRYITIVDVMIYTLISHLREVLTDPDATVL